MLKKPNLAYFLPVWCVICAPFLVFSARFPLWLALTFTALALLPALLQGYVLNRNWPLGALCAVFILSGVPTLYATAFTDITVAQLILFTLGVSLFLSLAAVHHPVKRLKTWTVLFLFAEILLTVSGPFLTDFAAKNRYFTIPWTSLSPFRVSEILDANLLAGLIAMSLPLVLSLILFSGPEMQARSRLVGWLSVLVLIAGLAITESRAGYLAALIGIAFTVAVRYRWLWRLYIALSLCAVTILLLTDGLNLASKVFSTGSVTGWEGRKEVWSRAIYMIQDFPFTGIGAGTFSKVAPLLYPLFLHGPDAEIFHAHNLFLQIAVDLGIPGLVCFVALLTSCLLLGLRAYRSAKRGGRHDLRALTLGYMVGLIVMVLHGLLDSPLWLTKPSAVPFFFMGMLVALSRPESDETGREEGRDVQKGEERTWTTRILALLRLRLTGPAKWWEILLLWVLLSLVSISFVGDHPYVALGIAALAGIYLGWQTTLDRRTPKKDNRQLTAEGELSRLEVRSGSPV